MASENYRAPSVAQSSELAEQQVGEVQGDARAKWLEVRGLAAGIVKNLEAFAASPHKAAWCGALDDSLSFADQIEKDAAAALAARQPGAQGTRQDHLLDRRNRLMNSYGNGDREDAAIDVQISEVDAELALIDQRDAAPGVGNG